MTGRFHGGDFVGETALGFGLDDNGHSHTGIVALEMLKVGIAQPDAPLAVASRHFVGIAGAAMNANSGKRCL